MGGSVHTALQARIENENCWRAKASNSSAEEALSAFSRIHEHMNGIVPIALFLVGFVAGALLLWLFRAGDARTLRETVANRDARLEKLAGDLAELKDQRSKLEANLDAERRGGSEKLALFDTAQHKIS